MNPLDFLSLAHKLAAGPGEAEFRSSVSRAYYSAFHSAHQRIAECGVKLPKSSTAHEKVTYCMQNCNDKDVTVAGSKLHSLRATRNAADYQLNDQQFTSSKAVAVFLAIAEEVIATSQRITTQQNIRVNIRKYAREVLTLPILGND